MSDGGHGGRFSTSKGARAAVLVVVGSIVVAVDQLTKTWALDHLNPFRARHVVGPTYLSLTFNRGAAFSMGSGFVPVVETVAVALVVGVVLFSSRLAQRGAKLPLIIGLGLLSGGALSNLADRFVRHHHGAVVDFIQLVSWWPIFNVADMAITVGAVMLALTLTLSPGEVGASSRDRGPARADARPTTDNIHESQP